MLLVVYIAVNILKGVVEVILCSCSSIRLLSGYRTMNSMMYVTSSAITCLKNGIYLITKEIYKC